MFKSRNKSIVISICEWHFRFSQVFENGSWYDGALAIYFEIKIQVWRFGAPNLWNVAGSVFVHQMICYCSHDTIVS